jgi:hypothetical protein
MLEIPQTGTCRHAPARPGRTAAGYDLNVISIVDRNFVFNYSPSSN